MSRTTLRINEDSVCPGHPFSEFELAVDTCRLVFEYELHQDHRSKTIGEALMERSWRIKSVDFDSEPNTVTLVENGPR